MPGGRGPPPRPNDGILYKHSACRFFLATREFLSCSPSFARFSDYFGSPYFLAASGFTANAPANQPPDRVHSPYTRLSRTHSQICRPCAGRSRRFPYMHAPLQVGKYLVSPLVRRDPHGRFLASVSIRSGRSSMTQDRLMRFTPIFDSSDEAARFATAQALDYIDSRSLPASPIILD